jgi:peptide/nickel transport system permease protein
MGAFVLRRLVQAVFTVLGVMLLTFVLFRLVTGDVTAQFVNPKLGKEARVAWLRRHRLDLPMILNLQRRIVFTDRTRGQRPFEVRDAAGSQAAVALMLERTDKGQRTRRPDAPIVSLPDQLLSRDTPLRELTGADPWVALPGRPTTAPAPPTQPSTPAATGPPEPVLVFSFRDGGEMTVDLSSLSAKTGKKDRPAEAATCGDLMRLVEQHPDNRGRLAVSTSEPTLANAFNSQFFWHLWESVSFSNRSYKTNELLLDVIVKRAKFSLAITVPSMALGWVTAMIIASIVAYYRDSLIDRVGVFLSVLGMCVPYLIYMIVGQRVIFSLAPSAAWGLHQPTNIYVPVAISVIAGVGGSVRFYRTVLLDEVSRDYVRTARAKGVPLPGILFRHVLKNCMLPILTSLVVSIPFLILGSLLLERFFGVPGLGSLMVSSVSDRDVPIISGLTFLTAVIYVLGLLITDLLYAVFDPRIRLR